MLHISHALDTVFLFSTIYMCIYEFLQLETIIIMCSCWFTNLLYGLPCKSLSLRRDSVPFAYNAICLFFDCHFARLWISVLLPCVCVCVFLFVSVFHHFFSILFFPICWKFAVCFFRWFNYGLLYMQFFYMFTSQMTQFHKLGFFRFYSFQLQFFPRWSNSIVMSSEWFILPVRLLLEIISVFVY